MEKDFLDELKQVYDEWINNLNRSLDRNIRIFEEMKPVFDSIKTHINEINKTLDSIDHNLKEIENSVHEILKAASPDGNSHSDNNMSPTLEYPSNTPN